MTHDPSDTFVLGGREYSSRLLVGTGKYASNEESARAIEASGAQIVTVAVRRIDLNDRSPGSLLDTLPPDRYTLLPNTAGCYTADEAIRTCRLAREVGLGSMVKLEVIGDKETLFPNSAETVKAARVLLDEGFTVLPYINDDPVVCKELAAMGCAAVMPLAAPIGSGLGVCNPYTIRIIVESVDVPVIVDAGVGTASDAAVAMELGVDAVLMNTGIAAAKSPVLMATAMRKAVEAGRLAYRAGRMPKKLHASASSPLTGLIV